MISVASERCASLQLQLLTADVCRRSTAQAFRQCSCTRVGARVADIKCLGANWSTVPDLNGLFDGEDEALPNINTLALTHGSLTTLGQDVFKAHSMLSLDVGYNDIQNINVNAFRGLGGLFEKMQNH